VYICKNVYTISWLCWFLELTICLVMVYRKAHVLGKNNCISLLCYICLLVSRCSIFTRSACSRFAINWLLLLWNILKSSQRYFVETFKCKAVQSVKQTFRSHSTTSAAKETCSTSLRLLGFSCGAGLVLGKQFYSENRAYCEAKLKSRIIEDQHTKQPNFDWSRFWQLLKPHWWYLIIAVSVNNILTTSIY
jgi:hypothetical protein